MKNNNLIEMHLVQARWLIAVLLVSVSCLQGMGQNQIPAITQSLSLLDGVDSIGNSAKIIKSSNTYTISNFIQDATETVTATVTSLGNVTIKGGQRLYTQSDGSYGVLYKYDMQRKVADLEADITGIMDADTMVIKDPWIVAVYSYDYYDNHEWHDDYTISKYRFPTKMTWIRPANGKVVAIEKGTKNKDEYYVCISQSTDYKRVKVSNFGNYGQDVFFDLDDEGNVTLPFQKIVDMQPDLDGYHSDYYSVIWTIDEYDIDNKQINGELKNGAFVFGKWGYAALKKTYSSYECPFNFVLYTSTTISFIPPYGPFILPKNVPTESTIGNVKYALNTVDMSATVLEIESPEENKNGEIVIPETITVTSSEARTTRAIDTNMLFTVRTLGDSILAKMAESNCFVNSVSFPSTIEHVSQKTFDNAKMKALIWNSNTKMPDSAFSNLSDSLKNMLLYVNNESIAPQNFANTIVMKENSDSFMISRLNLYEASEFYCPKVFQADSVSFTHKFTMKTAIVEKGSGGYGQGWETIVLPFDVEKISYKKNTDEYNLLPFDSYKESHTANDRPFWLYEWDDNYNAFKSAKVIEANKPYLISMPNNSEYAQDYNIEGDVTFSAQKTMVNVTNIENAYSTIKTDKGFYASYSYLNDSSIPKYNLYCLNSVNDLTGHGDYDYSTFIEEAPFPGSIFLAVSKLKRDAYPFEGFIALSEEISASREMFEIEFAPNNGESQGIDDITLTSIGSVTANGVFTIAGQRVTGIAGIGEANILHCLPKGLYIVNGKKKIVR